jgi:hypothetical protein
MERERVAQANAVVEGARKKLQEQSQDVKRMNQMVLYAKCVAIRDKQLAEKEAAKKKQKEDERAADAAMEEARQKKAAEMAAREAKRLEANKKGCLEIISQMQQRERERMLQREQKEREAMRTVEEIRRREKVREKCAAHGGASRAHGSVAQEDAEERQRKFLAGKELLKETLEANNAALAAKQKRKQEAVDEDNRIAAYLRDKEKREQEKEEEEARRKAEKDRNIALIREKQQKAIDQQSAVDELRAKRYQEAEDRKWRERELAAARKRQQLIAEMRHSREQQLQDKQRRLLEQALQDKAEFEAMVKWQNGEFAGDSSDGWAPVHETHALAQSKPSRRPRPPRSARRSSTRTARCCWHRCRRRRRASDARSSSSMRADTRACRTTRLRRRG